MKEIKNLILGVLVSISYNCKAQITPQDSNNYSTEIIGTWISDNDQLWKVVFTENNLRKDYYENELQETFVYSIESNSCGNESSNSMYFLKTIDPENFIRCFEILGINYENNNKLSLMDLERGKIFLFTKQ